MKKNKTCVMVCSVIAAICFGIVSYGHFYRGRVGLGCIFAALTLAQLALAGVNSCIFRKRKESE